MSNDFSSDALMDMFIFEMSQLINQLEEQVLTNEKANHYSDAAVNEIFRIMHTLKGSSSMMRFDNISSLAHSMEDLFYCIREGKSYEINHIELADLLLECVDFLKVEEIKISSGCACDGVNTELIKKIKILLPGQGVGDTAGDADLHNMQGIILCKEDVLTGEAHNFYSAHIRFDEGIAMENIHAYSIVHSLKKLQKEIYHIPEDIVENNDSADIIRKDGFIIFLNTEYGYEPLYDLLRHALFVKELNLIQYKDSDEFYQQMKESGKKHVTEINISEGKEQSDKNQELKEMKSLSTQQSFISVNVLKLDKLMDLVGEMVIAEAMVIQNSDLAGLTLSNFNKAARHLNKITSEIQDMVMSIRMVPLSATFHKMHRIVRDMNKKLGKEVELSIIGEDTEVDKNIIEHISDPLMHLVRNSVDHGIEQPMERVRKGKASTGIITIEAKNAGSDVIIQIKDDGQGLNKEKILQKAKENLLLQKQESELTDRELYQMILLPGFSTKDQVSEFSGRGVGMDVVSSNIASVGGSVSVDSIPDQGTTITLKIPLTLAIIDGMNIKVGSSHYTVPTINITEFFRPDLKNIIIDPHGNEMIMVRGQCYPIIKLYELYDIKGARTEYDKGIMIMVEENEKILCIFADELLGQQQVVVKTLPEYISKTTKINGLSGCTLLGNGSISLILDITALSI